MQFAYRAITFPCCFSASAGWIKKKHFGNNQYQDEMRIASPCPGQTRQDRVKALDKLYSMHIELYHIRAFSLQLITGLNSMKLYETINIRGDVHIVALFLLFMP
jgi:hypothetical protein